jgi:hypothetical protein
LKRGVSLGHAAELIPELTDAVTGHPVRDRLVAQILVGVADLAVRLDQYEQAARLLAASVDVRGRSDRSHPDAARIERDAQATQEGTQTSWSELVEVTLGS